MKTVAVALIQSLQIVKEWPFHKFLFFFKLIQCSVIFGGRYMCICQTCVFFKFVQFCKAFHGIYTMYIHVCACKVTNQSTLPPANGMFINPPTITLCTYVLSQKIYLVQCWALGKKTKEKKSGFFPRKRVRHWSMAVAGIFKVNFFSGESNIHHKLQLLEP